MAILSSPGAAASAYRLASQRITPTGVATVERMDTAAHRDYATAETFGSLLKKPRPIPQIPGTTGGLNPMIAPSAVGSAQVLPPLSRLLSNAIETSADTVQAAEDVSVAAVQGRANINDVVMAVSEAQLTLKTIMTVRDRVLDAYREILRTTI